MPGASNSAAYRAAPVTLRRPSTRSNGRPTMLAESPALPPGAGSGGGFWLTTVSPAWLEPGSSGLGFNILPSMDRTSSGITQLRERAQDRALRKLDLELIVLVTFGAAHRNVGRFA